MNVANHSVKWVPGVRIELRAGALHLAPASRSLG
jgi:hypothetical protein